MSTDKGRFGITEGTSLLDWLLTLLKLKMYPADKTYENMNKPMTSPSRNKKLDKNPTWEQSPLQMSSVLLGQATVGANLPYFGI